MVKVRWGRGTGKEEVVGFDRCEELRGEDLKLLPGNVLEVVHSEETLPDLPPPILLTLILFFHITPHPKYKPKHIPDHSTKTTVLLVEHFLHRQLRKQLCQ